MLFLWSACSKQDEFEYIDDTESATGGEAVTATDENGNKVTLTPGSVIGIYVVGEDGSVILKQVVVDENGNAVLPASTAGNSIIAYTPYQEDWGDDALTSNPVFTVKSNQSTKELFAASDLMIGIRTETTRADNNTGGMVFHHMLAKVAVHIIDETGQVDLNRISAELLNVNNSVRVHLMEQKVSTIEEQRTNINMLAEMITDWRVSSYAIVAPQYIAEGSDFLAITLYGSKEIYPIPQAATLESGKTYTINMRLTEHGLMPDGWSITDWDEEGEENLNIRN
ncbi:MAG: fimbrillin family protein [Prevotella sp.]|nr:fimbrillin family protein [Prevotella sp.]